LEPNPPLRFAFTGKIARSALAATLAVGFLASSSSSASWAIEAPDADCKVRVLCSNEATTFMDRVAKPSRVTCLKIQVSDLEKRVETAEAELDILISFLKCIPYLLFVFVSVCALFWPK